MPRGHLWTLLPLVGARFAKEPPAGVPWSTPVASDRGDVRLHGRFVDHGDDRLVVVVHGLGGSVASHYVREARSALDARRISHLALNLRGADRASPDFYHAGLIDDLDAVFASPEVRDRARTAVWGSSLGGHVSLRWAALHPAPSLAAVVAVCPPLDLAPGAKAIDHPSRRPYLRHVLSGLVEIYEGAATRTARPPVSVERARAIRSIRAWDEEIVAPWHGFRSAEDYWEKTTVGPHLARVEQDTLLVVGDADPMVPLDVVQPWLGRTSPTTDVRIVSGGHVGFPPWLSLGFGDERGLAPQVVAYLEERLGPPRAPDA